MIRSIAMPAAAGLFAACQTVQPDRFALVDADHDQRLSRDDASKEGPVR